MCSHAARPDMARLTKRGVRDGVCAPRDWPRPRAARAGAGVLARRAVARMELLGGFSPAMAACPPQDGSSRALGAFPPVKALARARTGRVGALIERAPWENLLKDATLAVGRRHVKQNIFTPRFALNLTRIESNFGNCFHRRGTQRLNCTVLSLYKWAQSKSAVECRVL